MSLQIPRSLKFPAVHSDFLSYRCCGSFKAVTSPSVFKSRVGIAKGCLSSRCESASPNSLRAVTQSSCTLPRYSESSNSFANFEDCKKPRVDRKAQLFERL